MEGPENNNNNKQQLLLLGCFVAVVVVLLLWLHRGGDEEERTKASIIITIICQNSLIKMKSNNNTLFSVRSKPKESSLSYGNVFQYLNSILSLSIFGSLLHILYRSGNTTTHDHFEASFFFPKESFFDVAVHYKILIISIIIAVSLMVLQMVSLVRIDHSKLKVIEMSQIVCQVQILPWGVQIREHVRKFDNKGDTESANERILERKCTFVPMEKIIDVIVVERVLSYRVKSCILLRTKKQTPCSNLFNQNDEKEIDDNQSINFIKGDEKRNNNISLVEVFSSSMVELSYSECTKMWKEINNVLQQYQRQRNE